MTLYAPAVASQATRTTPGDGETGAREKFRRRPPSPAEAKRRTDRIRPFGEAIGRFWARQHAHEKAMKERTR